ncbi:MAG: hypothetical protein JSU77_13680 [Fidelibacterota bacterium]|nr:MAG: hypothetical protein JSU77_13680 [Candidatus Neomarinimicrobiota bacterium]
MTTIGIAAKTWLRAQVRPRQKAFEKVRSEYRYEIARMKGPGTPVWCDAAAGGIHFNDEHSAIMFNSNP